MEGFYLTRACMRKRESKRMRDGVWEIKKKKEIRSVNIHVNSFFFLKDNSFYI